TSPRTRRASPMPNSAACCCMFPRLNVTAIVGEEAGKGTAQLLEKARRVAVSWGRQDVGRAKDEDFWRCIIRCGGWGRGGGAGGAGGGDPPTTHTPPSTPRHARG